MNLAESEHPIRLHLVIQLPLPYRNRHVIDKQDFRNVAERRMGRDLTRVCFRFNFMCCDRFHHSNSTSNWFTFTDDPGITGTLLTTAACGAVICISIFMDSSTITTWFASTACPGVASTLITMPVTGLRHSFSLLCVSAVSGSASGTGISTGTYAAGAGGYGGYSGALSAAS